MLQYLAFFLRSVSPPLSLTSTAERFVTIAVTSTPSTSTCLPWRRSRFAFRDSRQGSSEGAAGVVSASGEGGEQGGDSGNASSTARSGNSDGAGGGGGQGGGVNLSGLARGQPAENSDDDSSNTDGEAVAAAGAEAGAGAVVALGQGEMGEEFQVDGEAGSPSSVGGGSRSGDPAAGLEGEGGGEEVWVGRSLSDTQTEEVMSPRSLDSMSSKDQLPWLEPSEVIRHVSYWC